MTVCIDVSIGCFHAAEDAFMQSISRLSIIGVLEVKDLRSVRFLILHYEV